MTNLAALPVGTRLAEDYRIDRVLGAGGFGITYLAEETPLARLVTIKEYFPVDFAVRDTNQAAQPRSGDVTGDYQWGLDRFLDEARTLARFDHPNIVRVYRFFRENNSGFMVLHYEDGKSFKAWLKALGRAPRQHELDRVVPPLLDALSLIHGSDFLHRDIAPDNIIIRTDGSPVLIDFGSARSDIAQHSRTVSALVKPGYSPYEQYATTGRQQGPWTDIYSLGATLYQAVTGKRPPDSPSRMVDDELVPARDAAISAYRPGFLAAIDAALALDVNARPRSVDEWRKQLLAPVAREAAPVLETVAAAAPEPARASEGDPAAAPKSKIKAKAKAKESDGSAPAAKKTTPKPSPASETSLPPSAPRRPISEGRVAAIFSEWRERRAARLAAAPPSAAAPAATPTPAPAAVVASTPVAAPSAAVDAPAKSNLPAVIERRAPRPARTKKKRSWRPLIIKGIIGLGIAALAVAYQNSLPRVERQGQGTFSSGALPGPRIAQIKDAHKGGVQGVGYTADGRQLVTIGNDGTLKLWDSRGLTLVRTSEVEDRDVSALAVGAARALTGHKSGRIAVWDLELGIRLADLKRNEAEIHAVAFAGMPDHVLAAGHDWKLALFNVRAPIPPMHVFEGHESAVQAVAFSASRGLIASGSADRTVRLWNAETFDPGPVLRGHQDFVTALAFAADGRMLASGDLAGTVRIWSMTTRRAQRSIRAHRGAITAIAYSPDAHWLATAGRDGLVKLWDTARQRPPRVFSGHEGEVRALSFAPEGTTLASAGADGTVRFWSTAFMARRGS